MEKDYYTSGMRKKQPTKGGKAPRRPGKLDKEQIEKHRRNNMLINAKKRMDQEPPMMGNPGVVETYEDARENAMINRNIPTLKGGGEVCRGGGAAIKGKGFKGIF